MGLFLVLAVLLTGCIPASGGVPGKLFRAVDQSLTAVKTSSLALRLDQEGKSLPGVTSSALTDMLGEITKVQSSVAELSVDNDRDRSLRRDTLAAFGQAAGAVLTSQDIQSMGVPPEQATQALTSAQDRLEALKQRLGPGQ